MKNDTLLSTSQYLTFALDNEIYAIEISQVREVLDISKITRVPRMPTFMRGVINLRGSVVPVVDLRKKFEIGIAEDTVDTCIIIMELIIDGETAIIGAISDSVKEVITLEPDQIEPAPKIGTRLHTDFIKGMTKKDDEFIIMLDINKVFSAKELEIVQGNQTTKEEIPEEPLHDSIIDLEEVESK